jgi:hypothetical protein
MNQLLVSDSRKSAHGEIIYFYYYNLPDAWQVGFNPTSEIPQSIAAPIRYDNRLFGDQEAEVELHGPLAGNDVIVTYWLFILPATLIFAVIILSFCYPSETPPV